MSSSMFGGTELNIHYNDRFLLSKDVQLFSPKEMSQFPIDLRKNILNYGMASKFAKNHGEYIEGFEN
jgi:hypothetical protein